MDAGELAIAVIIFIVINLIPLLLTIIVFKKADELEREENVGKFGTIYGGKNVAFGKDHQVWKHPLTFFYRRLAFMSVTVFLADIPQLQMMVQ